MVRRGLLVLLVTGALGAGSVPAEAADTSYVRSLQVNDNGSFIRWDFVVCTPSPERLSFEVAVRRVRTGEVRYYEGFKAVRQGRNCGRYELGVRQRPSRFTRGELYRTLVRVHLSPTHVLRSPKRTFRVF
jgi:hypothetical protein